MLFRIIASRTFPFFVGEDEQRFTIHEEALASLSPSLAGLMQGQMSESLKAQATWKDVNANTFQAFVQFGYTGDYSVPVMILQGREEQLRKQDADDTMKDEALSPGDEFGLGFTILRKDKKRQKEKASPSPFESRTYTVIEPRSRFARSCDPMLERGSPGNIHEILLIHASLYVLADKWAVDGMKGLSLFKLHKSLTL